jgi:hypothetical protein
MSHRDFLADPIFALAQESWERPSNNRSQSVVALLTGVGVHVRIERYVIEMLDILKRIEGQF